MAVDRTHIFRGIARAARAAIAVLAVLCVLPAPAGAQDGVDEPAAEQGPAAPAPGSLGERLLLARGGEDSPARSAAAGAPASGREAVGWGGLARTGVSLAGVLGLIFALAAVVRRLTPRGMARVPTPSGVLEVLARFPVARGQGLVLIKLDRRVLLVCHTLPGLRGGTGGMSLLCELTDPEEVAEVLVRARDGEGDGVAAKFRSLMSRFEGDDDGDAGMTAPEDPGADSFRLVSGNDEGDRVELLRDDVAAADWPRRAAPDDPIDGIRRRLSRLRAQEAQV